MDAEGIEPPSTPRQGVILPLKYASKQIREQFAFSPCHIGFIEIPVHQRLHYGNGVAAVDIFHLEPEIFDAHRSIYNLVPLMKFLSMSSGDRNRTCNLLFKRQQLYLLSYTGTYDQSI